MQSAPTFVTQGGERHEGRKNYVFVDEHNRHKRLKVMRACNGCRKRKIKCDSATTNIWPCSACNRLKLVCIPPSIEQDSETGSHDQADDLVKPAPTASSAPPPPPPISAHVTTAISSTTAATPTSFPMQNYYSEAQYSETSPVYDNNPQTSYQPQQSYIPAPVDNNRLYQQSDLDPSVSLAQSYHYDTLSQNFQSSNPTPPQLSQLPQPPQLPQYHIASTQPLPSAVEQPPHPNELADVFGELEIDESGIAPYLRQQKQSDTKPETTTPDQCEAALPSIYNGPNSTVHFPPQLLPDENTALEYFRTFFNHIHPYVPVLHKSDFYLQWKRERWDISPLLLASLFACTARISTDPSKVYQWLALANKLEPEFMEAPRLSTVQALLLLLKAREAMPRKGYYYRSWQTVKILVSMSKDLDLHEHFQFHAEGKMCGYDTVECLIRTRVWQTILVVEIMIGGPQGRSDFGIDTNTVETRPAWDIPNLDAYETERSRQFSYFVLNAANIRRITEVYHKLKKQKDWGSNPHFVQNNPLFNNWLTGLPSDLQVSYPSDGSPPWIPSHFVGNMHSHFELAIIIMHRPQFTAARSFTAGGEWKIHFSLCYSSAKNLCRLQEAILASYGVSGLLSMLRGINFTLYGILTSAMIHLVAITSPDPEFHTDARQYFTRHMRILEQCSSSWPMPEIQTQLDSLRLAFSANINKPFELKPSFPYGSPVEQPVRPVELAYDQTRYHSPPYSDGQEPEHRHLAFTNPYPISPPTSAQSGSKPESPIPGENYAMAPPYGTSTQPRPPVSNSLLAVPLVDENSWDPTRIITQWDLSFSAGPSANSPPPPTSDPTIMPEMYPSNLHPTVIAQHTQQYAPALLAGIDPTQHMSGTPYDMLVMGARDWQKSVASVFDPEGAKRRWQGNDYEEDESAKRRR
ncbi:hypothetical protein FQN57_005778 [Myotisia sp. PD_48]|nr:hypothetical protein FQN57_005778 [Myotisia sp. PD_48]